MLRNECCIGYWKAGYNIRNRATGKVLEGKPYAGNPHVRFDEGEVASVATPRRGSLLYRT